MAPQVQSATAVTSVKIRVVFDSEMLKDAQLTNKSNYTLGPLTPGAAPLYVNSITTENVTYPTFVELDCSEMTDGASYKVTVANVKDKNGIDIDPANDDANFTGLGTAPAVDRVVAIGTNRADVIFTEAMADNADLRNPAKYGFDQGLSILSVLDVVGDTVKLVTTDQDANKLYNLTITV